MTGRHRMALELEQGFKSAGERFHFGGRESSDEQRPILSCQINR